MINRGEEATLERHLRYKDYKSAYYFDKDNGVGVMEEFIFGFLAPNGLFYPCHFAGHSFIMDAIKYWHPDFKEDEFIMFKRDPFCKKYIDYSNIYPDTDLRIIFDETNMSEPTLKQKEWLAMNWDFFSFSQREDILDRYDEVGKGDFIHWMTTNTVYLSDLEYWLNDKEN